MTPPPFPLEPYVKTPHNRKSGAAQAKRQLKNRVTRRTWNRGLRLRVWALNREGLPRWMR